MEERPHGLSPHLERLTLGVTRILGERGDGGKGGDIGGVGE